MITAEGDYKPISLWLVPVVGLAFASTQLSWALFNIAVPIFLKNIYHIPIGWVGFIMTWDNIIGFFVQPYVGSKSDSTRSRIGRRLPYIIPGIILGAIFFYLIQYSRNFPLYVFLSSIVVFNLSMALYRSPAVSLMPDLVAKDQRSIGNGIVNLVGGAFSGASLFIAGSLLDSGNTEGAFAFVSIGMLLSLVILVSIVREPKYEEEEDVVQEEELPFVNLRNELSYVFESDDPSYKYILFAILAWFIAWNAIEALYSIYVSEVFLPTIDPEEAAGQAGKVLFIFPIIFVIFTLIGGILGTKIGRLRTMRIGLLFFTAAIIIGAFVQKDSLFGLAIDWQTSYRLIFIIAGAAWGLVNVNSIVVVWHHASDNGTGTGIYYAFASAAAILGPTLAGALMQIQLSFLFFFSITALFFALFFLFRVKTGEASDPSISKAPLSDAIEEMMD